MLIWLRFWSKILRPIPNPKWESENDIVLETEAFSLRRFI